jgi:tetratricopeptide (TPR) repeat protein
MRGESSIALSHFERVAQSDSHYVTVSYPLQQSIWTYVGRAQYGLGRFPEARPMFERALSEFKDDSIARLYLGLTLLRQYREPKMENPLSLDDILFALREGVGPRRVATLVRERGVGFDLTAESENLLKKGGADRQLFEEIAAVRATQNKQKQAVELDRDRGLKETATALKDLHTWLEYIPGNTTYGQFWDPAREIRSRIQLSLSLLSGRNPDLQKIVSEGEWVGQRLEQEIDSARRDELRDEYRRRSPM